MEELIGVNISQYKPSKYENQTLGEFLSEMNKEIFYRQIRESKQKTRRNASRRKSTSKKTTKKSGNGSKRK